MLTGGNPHFVSAEPVCPVFLRDRFGLDIGERGTSLRFRQTHGAKKTSGNHRFHKFLFLLFRPIGTNDVGRPDCQKGITGSADVCRIENGATCHGNGRRKLHAANIIVVLGTNKASFNIGLQGFFDFRNYMDFFSVESRLILICFTIVRLK